MILSIRGVMIPIDLVSSATDSIRRRVVLFKPVPILTSDPKSEFLCQSSFSCAEPTDPLNTSYAWDISHASVTMYHPYCHSPSALTEYLKQKLCHQRAKRLGHSLPAQVEPNVLLEHNTHASSPRVACWPLPGLCTGLCTLALCHQSRMLLLPPSPRLPTLPPQPPLLGERWEFSRVDGGMHTHEAPAPSAGQGGEWRSLHKRWMCGGHSPPLQGRGCEHNPVHCPMCTTPAHPTFRCHHAHAIPHAGQHAPGTRRWGMQGLCMWDGMWGCAHTQWGRGSASLWHPHFLCCPRVVHGPCYVRAECSARLELGGYD